MEERAAAIVAKIAAVSDLALLRNITSPQAKALKWLIEEDEMAICPDDVGCGVVQRWTMATFYYSTGGDLWFECSHNTTATDNCGVDYPFSGEDRFMSKANECFWAGIKCNANFCVTQIEFGEFCACRCCCHPHVPKPMAN
jgi:hypothetical protein